MNEHNSVQFLMSSAGSFHGDNPCCREHSIALNRNRRRAHAEIDLSNFAHDWQ